MIHTFKGSGIVKKAEVFFFLELFCFFNGPVDAGNLISGSAAFSKSSLNIWKFTIHVRLKPGLENFEHFSASVWGECNCVRVWTFFGIAFLSDYQNNGILLGSHEISIMTSLCFCSVSLIPGLQLKEKEVLPPKWPRKEEWWPSLSKTLPKN